MWGCDALFHTQDEVEKHIEKTKHCRACGKSAGTVYNPIDYAKCWLCDNQDNATNVLDLTKTFTDDIK
jgi:hypothetical protein